jgi:ATP-dependent DNA ligase
VSKRLTAPYRSGSSRDWIKVKNPDSPAMRRAREHFARLTVGWFYFRNNPDTARHAGVLERDEARRMAVNFATRALPGHCISGRRRRHRAPRG